MYESFFEYIEDQTGLCISKQEREIIQKSFQIKMVRRRQYLLQEGDPAKLLGFVIKGALRQFSVDDKGNEHIVRFATEGRWITDYESYQTAVPSLYYIEAVEPSQLLVITNDAFHILLDNSPIFFKMIFKKYQEANNTSQKRMHSYISMTAEQRYADLVNSYPQLALRFSQKMIASYLGISGETLSRIRKHIVSKKIHFETGFIDKRIKQVVSPDF
ncbi:Crp/Fnr family transcriptional regulator [Pedobacter sp.]|jgi:CRP-like cAMP-binding protein|uniref:Crp/Fnr family transcriptional regulator n=1 Tax=Pedobacter sp. TaxID=1411316 RepID=UPI002C36C330|nr:Crp/Fnr family transcriptional regulator [Pedobacter sp.]HWW39873.1 Crp/Fnr family transcriptional regulator [Pedobacter sp.]